jgi:hypothetical protein
MINSISSPVSNTGQALTGTRKVIPVFNDDRGISQSTLRDSPGAIGSNTVSLLASQLSEASIRAQARDIRLTRTELASMARNTFNELTSPHYTTNKSKHDTEVPDTDNPELLARAKSATQYTRGAGNNPFSGMPLDQLTLITYDESGTFTVNERRAALKESAKQEFAWQQKVVAEAEYEYNTTGKLVKAFQSFLDHYKGLPLVEQAQYPDNYETKLQGWIDLDFNYFTHTAEGKNKLDIESFVSKVLTGRSSLFDNTTSPK